MTWTAPRVERTTPPLTAAERESLEGWLDFHRSTLLFKCEGLHAGQLTQRAIAPSSLTLLGLVRHMAEVERSWFVHRFAGLDLGELYCTDEYPDGDFDLAEASGAERDFATFWAECERARSTVAGRSLDDTFTHARTGNLMNLRWIYAHMIEEYARHNGHADVLREQIDGLTGM